MQQPQSVNVRADERQPAWLAEAWGELGVHEVPGHRHSRRVLSFFRDADRGDIKKDEVPWCAAFVGACLERAGQEATGSLLARSYLDWGKGLEAPRFGAVAVLTRGANPRAGHVGFWVGETADKVFLLGGNQSDAVTVSGYAKSRLLGFRWPSAGTGRRVPEPAQEAASAQASETARFRAALAHVLEMEGGFTDDPDDPGGPTNKGVILSVFAKHMRRPLTPATRAQRIAELKRISDDAVEDIYRGRYWTPSRAAEMTTALGFMHFDASVNQGLTGAAKLLQQALRRQSPELDVDGEIGPLTMAAIRRAAVGQLLADYAEARRDHYRALHHFWKFGRGWLRRVDRTAARARALLGDGVAGAGEAWGMDDHQTWKGNDVSETSGQLEAPGKWWGQSMTIWGTAITALSTVLPVLGPAFGLDVSADVVREAGDQLVSVVQAVGGLVGTIMTIYGRTRASRPLKRRQLQVHI